MTDYLGDALDDQPVEIREPAYVACGCGARYSVGTWKYLQLVQVKHFEADGIDEAETIEMRLCRHCTSTLGVSHK